MSIFGILSSGFLQKQLGAPSTPNKQSIEQLGKDLQSGNLAAAQSDFATLQKAFAASASAASTSNPVAQAFNQLATDLKSGNLSAAQKDFSVLQQDLENLRGSGSSKPVQSHHSLRAKVGDLTDPNSLLQNLTSGNLFAAQQAYAALRAQAPVSTVFGQRQTEPPVSGPPISTGGLPDAELTGPPISVLA
jgi:phage I-like protein